MPLKIATMPEPAVVPARTIKGGRIAGLYLTADTSAKGFQTSAVESLPLEHDGVPDSRHRGWTRGADSRVPYLPRGTPIRNTRALSIVSAEDLAEAARLLSIPQLDPRWIGASVLTEGIERLSFLPRGTRIFCDGGAILVVEDMNAPCRGAGAAIAGHNPGRPELELEFPKRCQHLRGLIASIEHPGTITAGTDLTAKLPAQWLYV
jgi:hypothetical protein